MFSTYIFLLPEQHNYSNSVCATYDMIKYVGTSTQIDVFLFCNIDWTDPSQVPPCRFMFSVFNQMRPYTQALTLKLSI